MQSHLPHPRFFLQLLIDDYIMPLLGAATPVFSGLVKALAVIGVIYIIGILSSLFYSRIMVTIAQGTLKQIRDEMFAKMQRLPIRTFDTRTHGDIMSLYTNDTDALRQMIAQSMAQLIFSIFTIAAVFVCMIYISVWLTLVAVSYVFDFAARKSDYRQDRRVFHDAAKNACGC